MKTKIKTFSLEHKHAVLSISAQQIGKNFIDESYLTGFLNNQNAKGIVAVINKNVVGFSFFQWCSIEELLKHVFTDKSWLREIFAHRQRILIGYRNLTAVTKDFQSMGIGNMLVGFSIKELEKKTDTIVNVVWTADNKKNLKNALRKYGLKLAKKIPCYWKNDSVKRNYECAVCGLPPCNCSAEIYITQCYPYPPET